MRPSVPFAALYDPINFFDNLDRTYPPERCLAHLSTRIKLQLGPRRLDIHSFLTCHSRRISILFCFFTGTASNWNDRLAQVDKKD